MHFLVRQTNTRDYYAGHGAWTPDSELAFPFPSAAADLGEFAGSSPLLEMILHSDVTHSNITIPSVAIQAPASPL